MALIHSTSIVSESCRLADDVVIGPFCVLNNCVVGAGTVIESHCCIGGLPEITGFTGEPVPVYIGHNVRIRSHVTIHSGSVKKTHIDDGAQIFRHAHIAHDCYVGKSALISGGAMLGGHSQILEQAIISGGATIHQFVVIGQGAFVGASCHINRHVPPFSKIMARTPAFIGKNEILYLKQNSHQINLARQSFERHIERGDPTNATKETKLFE